MAPIWKRSEHHYPEVTIDLLSDRIQVSSRFHLFKIHFLFLSREGFSPGSMATHDIRVAHGQHLLAARLSRSNKRCLSAEPERLNAYKSTMTVQHFHPDAKSPCIHSCTNASHPSAFKSFILASSRTPTTKGGFGSSGKFKTIDRTC